MTVSLIEQLIRTLAADPDQRPRRLLAKLISHLENEGPLSQDILRLCTRHIGRAYRVGFTGPPGAGKSTLVNLAARQLADEGLRIGIIAVDPTSAFTGGAILGDRLRMTDVGMHANVFVRSMATRGSMGGMCRTAHRAADVMDAWGMDIVLLETVGIGQSEIDIVEHADTTIVVLVPESGDGVQAMKAGLMEIADLFVVNKSDRDQANFLKMELESALELRAHTEISWLPPVIKTVATQKIGGEELVRRIRDHRRWLETTGQLEGKRRLRIRHQLLRMMEERIQSRWHNDLLAARIASAVEDVIDRRKSIYEVSEVLFAEIIRKT